MEIHLLLLLVIWDNHINQSLFTKFCLRNLKYMTIIALQIVWRSTCISCHWMKSLRTRSFSDPYFSAFGLAKLRIRTLFTQCVKTRRKIQSLIFLHYLFILPFFMLSMHMLSLITSGAFNIPVNQILLVHAGKIQLGPTTFGAQM